MTIPPGQSATLSVPFMMHGAMGGKHTFRLMIKSNDPAQSALPLYIYSNWIE